MLQYILLQLAAINEYLNQVRANSKRIDELPAATSGEKLIAVWNATGGEGGETGETQKATFNDIFNQNNIGKKKNLGNFSSEVNNPIAQAVIKINFSSGMTITDVETPYILFGIKQQFIPSSGGGLGVNIPISKYTFLFLGGKGKWGLGGQPITSDMIYMLPPEAIQVGDISNSDTTQIIPLGDIGSESNFISTVNSTEYDFSDSGTDMTYFFSYIVTEGTGDDEHDVLYISQFVGEPGEYGGTAPGVFIESDFVGITNSDVTPSVASASYDDVLAVNNETTRNAVHKFGAVKLLFGYFGFDYTFSGVTTSVGFRDPTTGGKIYFPANRNEETLATLNDIELSLGSSHVKIEADSPGEFQSVQLIGKTLDAIISIGVTHTELYDTSIYPDLVFDSVNGKVTGIENITNQFAIFLYSQS